MWLPKMTSAFVCLSFLLASSALKAQNATIVKFELVCTVNTNYEIWGDESSDFMYINEKKRTVTKRTVDTIFAYAQQALETKFGVSLEKQKVSEDSKENMVGKITGFPNDKIKDVAGNPKYKKLFQVFVTTVSGTSTSSGIGPFKKKKNKIDMIVDVRVYDSEGKETEKFKRRTRMDEVKETKELFGFSEVNSLSGNELFVLFANSLDNALAGKN